MTPKRPVRLLLCIQKFPSHIQHVPALSWSLQATAPTTSGQRTLARAEPARLILNFDRYEMGNLFSLPTYRTSGVADAGISANGWLDARSNLAHSLDNASAVLLAYGISKPAWAAAKHHVEQVAWLESEICRRTLPVRWVGGAPRHPSRWQHYTYRAHPEIAFPKALTAALARREPLNEAIPLR